MNSPLVLCVPGPWRNSGDLIERLVAIPPVGRWMFAGQILADVHSKEHIAVEMAEPDEEVARAFEIAGGRQISPETLAKLANHQSTAYLFFDEPLPGAREKILKFSQVIHDVGGFAVKVESAGVAHEWTTWFSRLKSGEFFDLYRSTVVLIGGDFYYSCGMHHFGLPEVALRADGNPADAADMINQFNMWRIVENPVLRDGETFSLRADSPYFRLELQQDERHPNDDLFHNPHGVWNLEPLDPAS